MWALAQQVVKAQKQSKWRPREGSLLPHPTCAKRVLSNCDEVFSALQRFHLDVDMLKQLAAFSKYSKGTLALVRACAYFVESEWKQAATDSRLAAASATDTAAWVSAHRLRAHILMRARGEPSMTYVPLYPLLHEEARERFVHVIHASAVSARVAFEIDPFDERNVQVLKAAAIRLHSTERAALMDGGWRALERRLLDTHYAEPLARCQLPKYYFYERWMEYRILHLFGELPEPIVDKLLAHDADELDVFLTNEESARSRLERLLQQYNTGGLQALQECTIPPLSWDERRVLQQEGRPQIDL